MSFHYHICGLTDHNWSDEAGLIRDIQSGKGCGYAFGHEGGSHTCPNCGREVATTIAYKYHVNLVKSHNFVEYESK